MNYSQNYSGQEENDLKKITELIMKNVKLFIAFLLIAVSIAFFINRYSIPKYNITASILIKEESQRSQGNINDYLNSNLFGRDQNFQNELWVIKSSPVVEKTIRNLDLVVGYYAKGKFNYYDKYLNTPFRVSFLRNHPQPLFTKFDITFHNTDSFRIKAEAKKIYFFNFETEETTHLKYRWTFTYNGKFGELIETPDLAFIIEPVKDFKTLSAPEESGSYAFDFSTVSTLKSIIASNMDFRIADRLATVIKISLKCESIDKGINILNELMNVYSNQKLERKNHIATITIEYIESQLNQISDSLSLTEDNLQSFRSTRQLLNINDQASEIYTQYRDLQNQLAEMVSKKRYFDHIAEMLAIDNFSNMMLPATMGIQDQLLNNLMSQLITAQAQRSNLIENNQERNPLVQKLGIQIENLKKTISDNISAIAKTTDISIEEMNKRVRKMESEISRLPVTQRQLGNIERRYRLNDAIYNYLREKHAEAQITKASNMSDDIIIEPAMLAGKISPNSRKNYLIAFFMGLALPFGIVLFKNSLKKKIESQDDIEQLTGKPVLGKILHNTYKTNNIMLEFPKSNIAESFRALRTNIDFYLKGKHKKLIMITSCLEDEGKSLISLNLAMSYALLGKKTILLDFDFRKPKIFFNKRELYIEGLSSYMIKDIPVEDITLHSPVESLDYVPAGILPPNPVELIALERNEHLLKNLKSKYDVIVLDTTPLAQVTDAFLLINNSDIVVIVTRQNHSFKKTLSLIMKDLEIKNVNNTCIVLNDIKSFDDQYGYGYGYYNSSKYNKKNIINKLLRKIIKF